MGYHPEVHDQKYIMYPASKCSELKERCSRAIQLPFPRGGKPFDVGNFGRAISAALFLPAVQLEVRVPL